jgi:membrane protease YdiL (CAAX protease family)
MRADATRVPPARFFILTYLLSWLIWIPLVFSHFEIGPFQVPEGASNLIRLVGVLMPATAAILLTALSGGRGAVRALLSRLGIWRVRWKWWAAATLVYPALLVLSALAYNWLVGDPPVIFTPTDSAATLIITIVFLLIASLGEEVGWRGVALPGLQQRMSALSSSLILVVFWGLWHFPFWLLLDSFDQFGIGYIGLNLLFGIPLTFYITWFYNHGKFSLMLPVAFHLIFNISSYLLPVTMNTWVYTLFIALTWIITFLIIRHMEPDLPVSPVVLKYP